MSQLFVAISMGSASEFPIVQNSIDIWKPLKARRAIKIISAHKNDKLQKKLNAS